MSNVQGPWEKSRQTVLPRMKLLKVDGTQELGLNFAFKSILRDIIPTMKLSSELSSLLDKALRKRLAALVDGAIKSALQAQRRTLLLKDVEHALLEELKGFPDVLKEIHAFASLATIGGKSPDLARKSRSSQAGLKLSISRVEKLVKAAVGSSLRVRDIVHIYLAAVLEKSLAMVFEKAAVATQWSRRKVVGPQSVQKALRDNPEFRGLIQLNLR
jgi:histone H3/H4